MCFIKTIVDMLYVCVVWFLQDQALVCESYKRKKSFFLFGVSGFQTFVDYSIVFEI